MEPMFPGKSEIDQLNKIFKVMTHPGEGMCFYVYLKKNFFSLFRFIF